MQDKKAGRKKGIMDANQRFTASSKAFSCLCGNVPLFAELEAGGWTCECGIDRSNMKVLLACGSIYTFLRTPRNVLRIMGDMLA